MTVVKPKKYTCQSSNRYCVLDFQRGMTARHRDQRQNQQSKQKGQKILGTIPSARTNL
jgi:hypothetical protein